MLGWFQDNLRDSLFADIIGPAERYTEQYGDPFTLMKI